MTSIAAPLSRARIMHITIIKHFDSIQLLLTVLLVAVLSAVLDKYWYDTFVSSVITVSIASSTSIGHRWRRGTFSALQLVRTDTSVHSFQISLQKFSHFICNCSVLLLISAMFPIKCRHKYELNDLHENLSKTKLSTPLNYAFFPVSLSLTFVQSKSRLNTSTKIYSTTRINTAEQQYQFFYMWINQFLPSHWKQILVFNKKNWTEPFVGLIRWILFVSNIYTTWWKYIQIVLMWFHFENFLKSNISIILRFIMPGILWQKRQRHPTNPHTDRERESRR